MQNTPVFPATEPVPSPASSTESALRADETSTAPASDAPVAASIKGKPPVVEEAAATTDATTTPAVSETDANDAPPATEPLTDDAAVTAAKVAPATAGDSGGAAAGKEPAPCTASVSVRSNLFGPAPLIAGEDQRDYDEVCRRFYDAVKPRDFVERIWLDEVAEFTWDAVRLRRLQAALLASTAREHLPYILSSGYRGQWYNLALDWAKGKRKAIEEVDARLAGMGQTVHSLMAQALTMKIDDFERIDRMILNKQLRRDAILREIDRHRTTLGQKLRDAVEQIEDAEFEVVEPDHGVDD
jgi:hypothetical protein